MAIYLGLLLFSFVINGVLIVPYIGWLFRGHNKRFGGIFVVGIVTLLFVVLFSVFKYLGVYVTSYFDLNQEIQIIFLTFIGFALLGLADDLKKIGRQQKWAIGAVLAALIALLLKVNLNISAINIPLIGVWNMGWGYILLPLVLMAVFIKGFNVVDRSDGLAAGVLTIELLAFWVLSVSGFDTPLSFFLAIWIGALVSFLYFNVYPARIWLGNAGSFAFGATFVVVGLLLGKPFAVLVMGFIFVFELFAYAAGLSILERLKRWSWSVPKIMMRGWLSAVVLAIFGIWLSLL
jgi:phospho-N-acetylmuramoyl-pentapeptide-transferase